MANEYALNLQDASLNPAAFALPGAASTSVTSAAIDLGADTFKPPTLEFELSIPALSTTIAPDTRTVTGILETSATSVFTTVIQTQSYIGTGAAGAGIGAVKYRFRAPSNCDRYVRFKVTFGASTTDGSALNATGTVRL